MTGGSQLTGQSVAFPTASSASFVIPQQTQGAQSFAMPDMFSTPGLTNVYQATGQEQTASMVAPTASTTMPAASAIVEPTASTASVATTASGKKDKKSSKKSSKKKLTS